MMQKRLTISSIIKEEDGMTLVELLGAMVILSIVLPLFIGFIIANAKMIETNTIQTEAIAIREELREWMGYRAQAQDIADLNSYVLATVAHRPFPVMPTDPEERIRVNYLILDESGITYDSLGNAKFDEKKPSKQLVDDEGNTISSSALRKQTRQVKYLNTGFPLPNLNISADRKKYVGMYTGPGATELKGQYAVLVEVAPKEITTPATGTTSTIENEDVGILVTLRIYHGESGKELTNTQFHWTAEY